MAKKTLSKFEKAATERSQFRSDLKRTLDRGNKPAGWSDKATEASAKVRKAKAKGPTVKDLRAMAKEYGIKGYSKMSKQELLMATGSRLEKPASPVRASAAAAGRARHNILQTARVGKTVVVQSHRRDLR